MAQTWWERWSFTRNWWGLYQGDPYWTPPYYPSLRWALEPGRNPHLARLSPIFVHSEALRGRRRGVQFNLSASLMEEVVAAAVALGEPRRSDKTAYLALLQCVNSLESFKQLLNFVAEPLLNRGYRRIIGPTGLSPHLGSGLLQDYWNEVPPLHTPYNPPYMPELAAVVLHPRSRGQLYHLEISPDVIPDATPKAELLPLDPGRLATDLLPLWRAACPPWLDFAPPDAAEAHFLLHWLGRWPLLGWVAQVDAQPVGFILLQPDLGAHLRQARGGRHLLGRLWLQFLSRRPIRRGRILYAGVLPAWQGQGIGRQLFHQAMLSGQQQGWQSLSMGPLPGTAPGSRFLERLGAKPGQTYFLYQGDL
jgi:ribosomal protein S18 acetylase RimI-like enzyme